MIECKSIKIQPHYVPLDIIISNLDMKPKEGEGRGNNHLMQPCKINLLLLHKFSYSRLISWSPHVKYNWSKSHVVFKAMILLGLNSFLFGFLFY